MKARLIGLNGIGSRSWLFKASRVDATRLPNQTILTAVSSEEGGE